MICDVCRVQHDGPSRVHCEECKAEKRRLAALHAFFARAAACPADDAERARRVELYAARQRAGLPIFESEGCA